MFPQSQIRKVHLLDLLFFSAISEGTLKNLWGASIALNWDKKLKAQKALLRRWLVAFLPFLSIFNFPKLDFYTILRGGFLRKKYTVPYKLVLVFVKSQLYLNLISETSGKSYMHLTMGMFKSFFTLQKSFRKNKILKLVMAKYLRKVFILLKVKKINIRVNSSPVFLHEFLNLLFQKSKKTFLNPLNGKAFKESRSSKQLFRVAEIRFLSSQKFTFSKVKKKGRVKRKVLKKIYKQNNAFRDELNSRFFFKK